jgi:hypothetical protein
MYCAIRLQALAIRGENFLWNCLHLLAPGKRWVQRRAAVARKLFDIQEDRKTKIQTHFVVEGRQIELYRKPIKGGYTIWKTKNGNPVPIQFDDLQKAIKECVK